MPGVTGVAFAACTLLAGAGVAKLVRPRSLSRALRALDLPGGRRLGARLGAPGVVRMLALAETVLAVAALVDGTRWVWAAVAVSYAGFTGFVALVRRRGGALASCGCFGSPDTPATRTHVAVNAGYAVACALAAAAGAPPSLRSVGVGRFVVVMLAAATLGYLSYVAVAVLPRVRATARLVTG